MIDEKLFEALAIRLMNAARDIEHEAAIEGHSLTLKISTGVNAAGRGFITFTEDEPPGLTDWSAESVYPAADPLPLLDDHTSDTDELIISPDLLTKGAADLPVEELLTDRERVDYKARRSGK